MVSAFLVLTLDYFVGRLFGTSNHVNSNATSICSNSPLYERPIHFLRVSPLTLDLESQKALKKIAITIFVRYLSKLTFWYKTTLIHIDGTTEVNFCVCDYLKNVNSVFVDVYVSPFEKLILEI